VLGERLSQQAGTLSGGERRMLSLSMALLRKPRLLMLDEPSLGLAPAVVSSIFNTIRELADTTGMAVLLLEQNVNQALALADRVYVMRNGRIIYQDSAERMRNQDASEWVSLF
jgi:branched-chain amino acid transport system ATP-binding protein